MDFENINQIDIKKIVALKPLFFYFDLAMAESITDMKLFFILHPIQQPLFLSRINTAAIQD